MEEVAPDYGNELDIYDEYVPSKADALDWYKWGRPYRTFRPRTMRYYSGKKVTILSSVITGKGEDILLLWCHANKFTASQI